MSNNIRLKGRAERIVHTLRREGSDTYRLPDLSRESLELAHLLEEDGIRCELPTQQEMTVKCPDEHKC